MALADPYDLDRFLSAQDTVYPVALAEIRNGRKQSHWMWFIFPQLDGLGSSAFSKRYAIKRLEEAAAYLRHPILGARLLECVNAVLDVRGRSVSEIFGHPDDMKLRSCATLFAQVSPGPSVFDRMLREHYRDVPDGDTLRLLGLDPDRRKSDPR